MYLEAYVSDCIFDPQRIAKSLMTDAGDLARTSGLGKAARSGCENWSVLSTRSNDVFDRRWWRMVGLFQNFCQAFPYTLPH
jgi:hypothetical protein